MSTTRILGRILGTLATGLGTLSWAAPASAATDLAAWLEAHPKIAYSIKWEFTRDNYPGSYDIKETSKISWHDWSAAQQADLAAAYAEAEDWAASADPYVDLNETIAYPPVNLESNVGDDDASAYLTVSEDYSWDMYTRWVAQTLLAEVEGQFPWSLEEYDTAELKVLLDSANFFARLFGNEFAWSTGNPGHPNYVRPDGTPGVGVIAPPRYTRAFLENSGLIGATRRETIVKVLDWGVANMAHFYNDYTYGNMEDHWGFRGPPPTTQIIEGTTYLGDFQHWTAGCHGTTAFWRNVLRAANIPVEIRNRCGHSTARFMSEELYVDHGDDIYNWDFRDLGISADALLLDQYEYETRFGDNPYSNDDYCTDSVARQIQVLRDEIEICDDGVDNDADGSIDCADSDCPSVPLTRPLKLVASDARDEGRFGVDVALNGGRLLVGAQGTSDDTKARGTTYAYAYHAGAGWVEEAKLAPSNAADRDFFGTYLGLAGDHALVSAELAGGFTGAVYAYARAANGTWSQEQVFAHNGAASGDRFASAIDMDGDRALIGAQGVSSDKGAAYVFERGAGGWTQKQKLTGSDTAAGSHFGLAVGIEDDLLAVGAPYHTTDEGAAYVFRRTGGTWAEEAKLLPTDPSYGQFGSAIEVANGRVVIGAPGKRVDMLGSSGAVYVFEKVGGTWTQTQKLTSPTPQALGGFGYDVAVDGDALLVSAYGEREAAGTAYRYEHDGSSFGLVETVVPEVDTIGDRFAGGVAIEGDLTAIGAYADPNQGPVTGAVYLYTGGDVTRGQCVSSSGGATSDPAVSVTFTSVSNAGMTEAVASTSGPAVPIGYKLGDPATYYEISTTADYQGPVEVCIDYSAVSYADESTLALFHYENGSWVNLCLTGSGCQLDTGANRICAYTTTLSPFVVAESSLFPMVEVLPGTRTTETIFLAQNFTVVGDQVLLDVYLKSPQPNPNNRGQVTLFVTLDGTSIQNQALGTKSFNGLPLNAWSTLSFTVPAATRTRLLTGIDTGRFSAQTITPTNAPSLKLNHLRFGGSLTSRAANAPRRSDVAGLLSFEGPSDWTATGATATLDSASVTDGTRSLRLHRTNTNSSAKSAAFFAKELGSPIGTRMTFDVYVPPGVTWGDVQAGVSCPVNVNLWVGSTSLVGKPANQWSHFSFTLPTAVRNSLLVANQACTLSLTLNAPVTTQDFRLDKLRIE